MNIKAMMASWKTAAVGAIVTICGGSHLAGVIPDQWVTVLDGVCLTLTGLGLIAAKDGDKSNSSNPGDAKTVQ